MTSFPDNKQRPCWLLKAIATTSFIIRTMACQSLSKKSKKLTVIRLILPFCVLAFSQPALAQARSYVTVAGSLTISKIENPLTLSHADAEKIDNILRLIDQRLGVARQVAMSKWNSGIPIDDPVREAQILRRVQQQAIALNLDSAWVANFFQAQIDANKLYQHHLHDQWRQSQHPPFAQAPDLVLEVRPILDALQTKLLTALSDLKNLSPSPTSQAYLCQRASQLIHTDVNIAARNMAISPLLGKVNQAL